MRSPMVSNFLPCRHPNTSPFPTALLDQFLIPPLYMIDKLLQTLKPPRSADDSAVQTDAHHLGTELGLSEGKNVSATRVSKASMRYVENDSLLKNPGVMAKRISLLSNV